MKQHLIALTGYAGTGKDTVADLLVEHLRFRKIAFAGALRAEVAEAYSIDMSFFIHPELKNVPVSALALRRGPLGFIGAVVLASGKEARSANGTVSDDWLDEPRSPRQLLQWWGTEYRRRQSPRYWTNIVIEKIRFAQRQGESRFVITDCRFENEADVVRAMHGRIWQINRPGIDANTTAEGAHASTTDGSEFKPDLVVNNAHDIRHLQQLVLGEFISHETGVDAGAVSVKVAA